MRPFMWVAVGADVDVDSAVSAPVYRSAFPTPEVQLSLIQWSQFVMPHGAVTVGNWSHRARAKAAADAGAEAHIFAWRQKSNVLAGVRYTVYGIRGFWVAGYVLRSAGISFSHPYVFFAAGLSWSQQSCWFYAGSEYI